MSVSSTAVSLIEGVQAGDEVAWSRLIRIYGPMVYRWCRSSGLTADEAADIVQTVFIGVGRTVAGFRLGEPNGSFRGWLRKVTRHKVMNHFRTRQRSPEILSPERLDAAAKVDSLLEVNTEYSDRSDRILLIRMAIEQIRQDFQTHHWTAFWRTEIDGSTATQVAAELGISAALVRQSRSRVLKRLRSEFRGLEEFFDRAR